MFDSTMFDVLSIVLIFGFELSCFADVVSTAWRVLFDVRLSAVLTRLENVHETLIRLNAVGPMTVKYERLAAIGVCIHFTAYICRQIRFVVLHLNTNNVPVVVIIIIIFNGILAHNVYEPFCRKTGTIVSTRRINIKKYRIS